MKLCSSWLRSWVPDLPPDDAEIARLLTDAGLEVKRLEPLAPGFRDVVVGRVLEVGPHPDADRLLLCQVDTGGGAPSQIVCGAPVVEEGALYPVAPPGAVLQTPDGPLKLRARKLRGQVSEGMICSPWELGQGTDQSGVWLLGGGLEVGQDLGEALGLRGHVLHFDLTPNRGDALSVLGMARELAALAGVALADPAAARGAGKQVPEDLAGADPADQAAPQEAWQVAEDPAVSAVSVALGDPQRCGYLSCRPLELAAPAPGTPAATPAWMCERLRRAGMRPISPIVDVTNYVMLELGQPLHAFDTDRLHGDLGARTARPGETLRLLDGAECKAGKDDLLITSGDRPMSLAGVMGGEHSGIGAATRRLLLECAWFQPRGIAATARRHRLHSESSHRFERGVDPALQPRALERAAALLLQICPGRAGPVRAETGELPSAPSAPVRLGRARLASALGIESPDAARLESGWKALGIACKADAEGWSLAPPSWRFDLERPADYVEEAARLLGYARIPAGPPPRGSSAAAANSARAHRLELRRRLAGRGWRECLTYSFVDPAHRHLCLQGMPGPMLRNPLASNQAMMRASLWPGLIAAARHNLDNRAQSVRLFELGRCFLERGGGNSGEGSEEGGDGAASDLDAMGQPWMVGGIACGPRDETQRDGLPQVGELKADLQALFGGLLPWEPMRDFSHLSLAAGCTDPAGLVGFALDDPSSLGVHHGVIAALRPDVAQEMDLPASALLFECVLCDDAPAQAPAAWQPFARYPLVRRDLALVAPADLSWGALRRAVLEAAGPELVSLRLFDRFASDALGQGKQSLAFTLEWQPQESTWDAQRIQQAVDAVLAAAAPLGATLRPAAG